MVDGRTGQLLSYLKAVDKTENARGIRRSLEDVHLPESNESPSREIPALLRQYISDYAATGLPPGYLPFKSEQKETDNDNR